MKRKFLFFLLGLLLLVVPAIAQDLGTPDSIKINPSTLYIGRSYPVTVSIVNDHLIKTFNLGLITHLVDTGFAHLDSIKYVGRMTYDTVMNLRLSGFRDANGTPPDTAVLTAFWAGPNATKLPAGNGAIVAIYMTGTHLGKMTIDSGFMPPGGDFLLIPWDTNFAATGFAPRFKTTVISIRPVKFVCGNVDGDAGGSVDIGDISALIDYLFISFAVPAGLGSANIDDSPDHTIDIADLSALIAFLFLGGPTPVCQPQ